MKIKITTCRDCVFGRVDQYSTQNYSSGGRPDEVLRLTDCSKGQFSFLITQSFFPLCGRDR